MAAANIENFSVCRFVMFCISLLSSPTDVVAGRLASAVPVRKWQKNRQVLREVTRKGAGMTENVKELSHAAAQRRNEDIFSLRRCAAAGEIFVSDVYR